MFANKKKPRRAAGTGRGRLAGRLAAVAVAGLAAVSMAFALCACSSTGTTDHASQMEVTDASGALNGYTWEELAKISSEIAAAGSDAEAMAIACNYKLATPDGAIDSTQVKEVEISKTLTSGKKIAQTAHVRIIGIAHDDKADGTKAGLTFQFAECIADYSFYKHSTNKGGWKSSIMREWLNGDVADMLPADLSKALVEVKKKTNNAGCTSDVASVTETADKMWLPSMVELVGDRLDAYLNGEKTPYGAAAEVLAAEGSQYELFKEKGVEGASNHVLAKKSWASAYGPSRNAENGKSWQWWQRSPNPLNANQFFAVYYSGNPCYEPFNGNLVFGVAPCFSV